MHLAEGYVVLKVSDHIFNTWYFFWPYKNTPIEKNSKLVHLITYLETEDFGVSSKHEIIVIMKPFLSRLRYRKTDHLHKVLLLFLVLHSGFIFRLPFWLIIRSSIQKLKKCKKDMWIRHADYPWVHFRGFCFCFWFFAIVSFSRFCRFAINVAIFDCNWFICFLKVSCVLISSFF